LPDLQARTHARGLALYAIGIPLHYIGDFARATRVLEEAKTILLETGDMYHAAVAGSWAGVTCAFMGDDASAVPMLEESIGLAREVGNHRALALGLAMLGGIGRAREDERLYRSSIEQAARIAREHGDWWTLCYTDLAANNLDSMDEERFAEAETSIRESMRIRTMIGSKRDLPLNWLFLAWAAHGQGDDQRAEEYLATGLRIAEETDHGWFKVFAYHESAILAAAQGDLSRALSLLARCLDLFQTNHQIGVVTGCLAVYGMIASLAGDAAGAARFLGASEALVPDPAEGRPEPGFWIEVSARRPEIVAALSEDDFREAYAAGAAWTIDKAIREALRYTPPTPEAEQAEEIPAPGGLSPREVDVLVHMAKGMSNQQIADTLFISYRTVTTHVSHIMTKLDVPTRTAAVSFAILNGIA
jgi:ATP/maltotriose-dependent transcriptional regulator MalT